MIACFCLGVYSLFFILYSLFFILYSLFFYSAGVAFLFLLFLTFLGWVDLGGFMVFVF
ncbi:putative membrane protein [Helicobacter pylori Hp A-8]|nr:putative membrane protein [Helicobacter pylori Hp A-8]